MWAVNFFVQSAGGTRRSWPKASKIFTFGCAQWRECFFGDLVLRNNIWYKKFSNTPFTGEISGRISGRFVDGKFDGQTICTHRKAYHALFLNMLAW